jgi:hypothetical protein
VSAQLAHWGDIGDLFGVGVKREALGHLPDEDLAILRGRRDNAIVERVPPSLVSLLCAPYVSVWWKGLRVAVPIGVEDGSSVATEQGNHIGQLASLVQRYHGKGATAGGIPIDRQELGVDLCIDPLAPAPYVNSGMRLDGPSPGWCPTHCG